MRAASDTPHRVGRDDARFAWALATLFAVLTLPRLLAHELWRDEAWLWLVVRESSGLADLFASLARSGQGYLFPLLCYVAKGISTAPLVLQLVHLVLAVCGVFVFVRWAPFTRAQRALFAFGYLPFYEYAVISRHYVAGSLLLWLGCAAAGRRRPALALGAALGLLCQTTVYGFILAVAVASGWLCDRWLQGRASAASAHLPARRAPLPRREAAAGLALAFAGGVAGLVQLIPRAGTSFAEPWHFGWDADLALRVLQMPWRAFALLPRIELHFWNSNLLDRWPGLQAAAGLLVLVGATLFVWPQRAARVTWLVGAAGFAAFGYIKYIGLLRHDGHWWLLFAAALWLGGGLPAGHVQHAGASRRRSAWRETAWRAPVFVALLLVHVAAALYASGMDLAHPFSNGARTAAAVGELGLGGLPLLGYREPPAAPVALVLGRPLFAPSRGVFTTHPDWGPEQHDLALEELRCVARALAVRERSDIGLVMNRELPAWGEIEPTGAVIGAIQASEDYHLYRLRHGRLSATAAAARCAPPG